MAEPGATERSGWSERRPRVRRGTYRVLLAAVHVSVGRGFSGSAPRSVGRSTCRGRDGRPAGGWIAAGMPHRTWVDPFVVADDLPVEPRLSSSATARRSSAPPGGAGSSAGSAASSRSGPVAATRGGGLPGGRLRGAARRRRAVPLPRDRAGHAARDRAAVRAPASPISRSEPARRSSRSCWAAPRAVPRPAVPAADPAAGHVAELAGRRPDEPVPSHGRRPSVASRSA